MAGVKISDLPAAPSALLTDVFPVDQLPGPITYKESNSQLLTLFKANGEALTRVNDTNVTMTLGGTPTTALFNATSMTLGWTGQLSVPRGGTGNSTFTAYSVICAGTTATGAFQNVSGLGTAGEQLTSNGPGMLPTWQTGTAVTPAALTRVDDTNVTLTLGGTPTTALLQATSITAGWAGQLSLARGGTNKNITPDNGALVYCDADSFELLAATATAGQIPRSGSNAAPTWSTATYPAAAGTSGNVLTSDGTNWNSAATAVVSPLTTKGDLYTFTTVNARLAVGTINGQMLQVNSGDATGLAWSTATYPATATDVARILRSDGTNWVQTTSTFADTYAASGFLYANGANNVAGLATANNGLPVTSNTGVPSILAGPGTTGNILQSNAAAAPSFSTSTYPSTNAINTLLYASSANVMAALATANSGVLVTSAGGVPSISSTLPAFTTSSITFSPTTSGIVGTTTNDNAAAGSVGEIIESSIADSSAVALTSGITANVTSISLTAGDWDVWGNVWFFPAAGTIPTICSGGITTTSATFPTSPAAGAVFQVGATFPASLKQGFSAGKRRISISGTTTVYLVGFCVFSVSTLGAYGYLGARRVR